MGTVAVASAAFVAFVSFGLCACDSGGVGDPCIPEDEYQPLFGGFSIDEVNIESRSFQCETRVCLVNHFEGRVSCPEGQSEDGQDGRACLLPGEDGRPNREGDDPADEFVEVPVDPNDPNRSADDAVYCSCRCAGPDPGARYCDCPSGYSCTEIGALDIGRGQEELAGSYCIKNGTEYSPSSR
jgi:hypothetical protein